MSFTVLVIPEDPTLNGHILKPLTKAIVADAGRPAARVTVLTNPRLRGYDQAVRAVRDELTERYGFMDLWLFFPDADKATSDAMQRLEADVGALGASLLCRAAGIGGLCVRGVSQRNPGTLGGCTPPSTDEGRDF